MNLRQSILAQYPYGLVCPFCEEEQTFTDSVAGDRCLHCGTAGLEWRTRQPDGTWDQLSEKDRQVLAELLRLAHPPDPEPPPAPTEEPEEPDAPEPSPSSGQRGRGIGIAAAGLVLASAIAAWWSYRPSDLPPPAGNMTAPAASPDRPATVASTMPRLAEPASPGPIAQPKQSGPDEADSLEPRLVDAADVARRLRDSQLRHVELMDLSAKLVEVQRQMDESASRLGQGLSPSERDRTDRALSGMDREKKDLATQIDALKERYAQLIRDISNESSSDRLTTLAKDLRSKMERMGGDANSRCLGIFLTQVEEYRRSGQVAVDRWAKDLLGSEGAQVRGTMVASRPPVPFTSAHPERPESPRAASSSPGTPPGSVGGGTASVSVSGLAVSPRLGADFVASVPRGVELIREALRANAEMVDRGGTADPGDLLAAIRQLPSPQRVHSQAARALNDEARDCLRRGESQRAVPLLERAQVLAPSDPEIVNNLGYAYLCGGETERAERQLLLAVLLNPKRINGWTNLGDTLAVTGRPDLAAAAFRISVLMADRPEQALSSLRTLSTTHPRPEVRRAAMRADAAMRDPALN